MNTNQYTQKTLEALQAAQQLAVEYQHNQLEPEHLLHALASQEQGLIPQLLQKLNVDPGSFSAAVAEKLSALPRVSGSGRDPDKVYISQATDKVLSAAAREAKKDSTSEERLAAARETLNWLRETRDLLVKTQKEGGRLHSVTDLGQKDDPFKKFLFDTLSKGEIRITMGGGQIRMEETNVPTIWRMLIGQQDLLVVAYIPDVVLTYAARDMKDQIEEPAEKPEGLFAAPAIISELNAAAKDVDFDHFDPTMVPVAVELTRQPLSPNDKDYINKVLGEGTIEVQMQGFAKSTIRQTSVRGLWRSRILNKAGKELLDQVEATPLPPEIPSTAEDLPGAIKKMDDLIEWVELDLSRGAL